MTQDVDHSSLIISWNWFFVNFFSVIAALLIGQLEDKNYHNILFYIMFPFILAPLFSLWYNWANEPKIENNDSTSLNFFLHKIISICGKVCLTDEEKYFMETVKISFYSFCVGISAILFSILSIFSVSTMMRITVNIIIVSLLTLLSFTTLPISIALFNFYFFIKELMYIRIDSSLFYFYTLTCNSSLQHKSNLTINASLVNNSILDTPQFSYTFYQSLGIIFVGIGSMVGIIIYEKYIMSKNLLFIFALTTILKVSSTFSDLILINRWNKLYLYIPDKIFYFFGDMILYPILSMMEFMPGLVVVSKLCPTNLETLILSLLLGFHNFGFSLSYLVGELLTSKMHIDKCQYENLSKMIIIAHIAIPLCSLIFIKICVPNKKIKEIDANNL